MIDCLKSFCLVMSRGSAHLAVLGLVSMMLHYVIVKNVVQGCPRQAALERQDLSCTYLAHHELESVMIIIIIMQAPRGLAISHKQRKADRLRLPETVRATEASLLSEVAEVVVGVRAGPLRRPTCLMHLM